MFWFLVTQIFSTLSSLIQIGRMTEIDKDLEIMVLRYQLGIAERKMKKPVRANRTERMTLAVLAAKLKMQTGRPANQFKHIIRLIQPETVFRWHRDLVCRKWTQENKGKRGRPRIDDQLENLIVRLATENLRWGYYKIEGELTKLGFDVTPIEAPNANAFSERWIRSVREECLDHVLILNERHLRRVLQTYIEYYNTRRPHQSLKQQSPIPYSETMNTGLLNGGSCWAGS